VPWRSPLLVFALAASAAPLISADSADAVHPQEWPWAHSRGLVDAATEARIDELLAKMSLEEKVGQIIQTDIGVVVPEDLARYPLGSILAGGNGGPNGDDRAPPLEWLELSRRFHAAARAPRPGGVAIPLMFGIDAVHGHSNMVGAVIFPHNIGLGAAHDPELVRRIGAATAEAVAATGIDWTFAPTLAVPQDVRWGRSYEGFSQDPALVREYARAAVEGLQGPPKTAGRLQAGRIAATAKHFIGDGGTFDGVDQGDARVSEGDLIRLHAQGYASAVDAGVMTVMASYSSWQGRKMHGNRQLLTDVLKGRMGFEGFVIGDWDGHAQVPGCRSDRCPAAINAGVDMFMAPNNWKALFDNTLAEARSGEIPAARLDDAVRRILRVKFRLGLFEPARPYEGRTELLDAPATRALAREAVRRSLVLLKNDGVLPIRASSRVLVTGPGADNIPMQCGGWSVTWQGNDTRNADFPGAESVTAAMKRAVESGGGRLVDGSDLTGQDRPDVAVLVYGEQPYAEMHGDLQFAIFNAGEPLAQLKRLQQAGIPTVTVFLSGRPLWVRPELEASDAFVAAWLPGTEGGGIADVLVGDAAGRPRHDFTGRLSFVWPNDRLRAGSVPAAELQESWPLGYGLHYAAGAAPPAGYRLVWADEFATDGLPDPGRWSYDTMSNRSGWANEERQYYAAARRENSRVENGVLILEARHEPTRAFKDSGGQEYTSARLVTNGHQSWTYGFFEIRAKLPCGRGTWPAIWMLADAPVINWPDIGEIDIMEHVGFDPGVVHGTIHTKAYNHVINTARGDQATVADACAAFHRYQLTWTPDRIVIGADDKPYFRFDREVNGGHDVWPFDAPQYLILNIAVGGTWGGQEGIDDEAFPERMEVDYVRVYQIAH
jgi:beta-glucosidase